MPNSGALQGNGLFFSHIPKNGGTSIRSFLSNQFEAKKVCPFEDWRPFVLSPSEELAKYRLFQGHFYVDLIRLLPQVDVISFFREPVARTLSLLLHLRRDPEFHTLHWCAKNKSVSEMLQDELIIEHFANQQTAYLGSVIDFHAAKLALQDADAPFNMGNYMTEPSLKLALRRLGALAFVGLTDEVPESLGRLSEKYCFHPCFTYAKRNAAPEHEKKLIADLSSHDLDRIKAMNQLDLELYEAVRSVFYARTETFAFDHLVRQSLQKHMNPTLGSLSQWNLMDPLAGTNWYEAEVDGGQVYRWSGPAQESSLEFPLAIEVAEMLQIEVFAFPGDDLSNTLQVTLDGEPQGPPYLTHTDKFVFDLIVAKNEVSDAKGYHQLLFSHQVKAFPDPGTGDIRVLHFGLSAVRFIGLTQQLRRRFDDVYPQQQGQVPGGVPAWPGLPLKAELTLQNGLISELGAQIAALNLAQTAELETLSALQARLNEIRQA